MPALTDKRKQNTEIATTPATAIVAPMDARARTRAKIIRGDPTVSELLSAIAALLKMVAGITGELSHGPKFIHPLKLADLAGAQKRLKTAMENFEQ
jgi:hypothetical protein